MCLASHRLSLTAPSPREACREGTETVARGQDAEAGAETPQEARPPFRRRDLSGAAIRTIWRRPMPAAARGFAPKGARPAGGRLARPRWAGVPGRPPPADPLAAGVPSPGPSGTSGSASNSTCVALSYDRIMKLIGGTARPEPVIGTKFWPHAAGTRGYRAAVSTSIKTNELEGKPSRVTGDPKRLRSSSAIASELTASTEVSLSS